MYRYMAQFIKLDMILIVKQEEFPYSICISGKSVINKLISNLKSLKKIYLILKNYGANILDAFTM